jgi:uncharacterized protein
VSAAVAIPLLVASGAVIGTLAGLLGVGGGVFMVPLLVLAFGAVQQGAQATSLLVILPTSIVAVIVLRRKGVLDDVRESLQLGAIGAVAAVGGSLLALSAPADTLRVVFGVFLGLTGLRLVRAGLRHDAPAH